MQHHKPQHLEALDRANAVRRRRYAIRRVIRGRHLSVCALFTEAGLPPADRDLIAPLELGELLAWGYRIGNGDTVAKRVLAATGGDGRKQLAKSTKLKALSSSRLADLVGALEAIVPDACQGADSLEALLTLHGVSSLEELEESLADRAAA